MKKASASLFRLGINKKDDDKLVGGWEDPQGNELRFSCSINELNKRGEVLKDKAREWAAEFEDGNATSPERWRELHRYAAECFKYLFQNVWAQVSKALAEKTGDVAIKVSQFTPAVIMPWGLLCTPADAQAIGIAEHVLPVLWGSKFNLTVTPQTGGSSIAESQPDWSFIPIVCETTFINESKALADAERALADLIHSRRVDPTVTDAQLDPGSQCFLYIYSHGGNGQIELVSNGVKRSHYPLDIVTRWVKPGGRAVAVLNACDTVKSTRNMGETLMLTTNPQEVVSVSTEFEIQGHFAMRFGLELIYRCVHLGESTIDAMKLMRRKHHPMSIVYSLYCLQAITLKRPLTLLDAKSGRKYSKAIKNVNFSDLEHGGQ